MLMVMVLMKAGMGMRLVAQRKNKIEAPKSENGFSLIEVLVAFFILGIGLLGLAGLQTVGLKNNHNSQMRTYATVAALDIAERMRANPQGVTDGRYDNQTAPNADTCAVNTTSNCSPANVAGQDLREWQQMIANNLPDGSVAVVCRDSTPDDGTHTEVACSGTGAVYAVKVWWNDGSSSGDPDQRYVVSFNP